MTDLTAKAQRAAEWWNQDPPNSAERDEALGWWIVLEDGMVVDVLTITDERFIALCEARGWQDQEQEADGVEWVTYEEYGFLGQAEMAIKASGAQYRWTCSRNGKPSQSGIAPTREEARSQAVEAARGMG